MLIPLFFCAAVIAYNIKTPSVVVPLLGVGALLVYVQSHMNGVLLP